VPLRAGLKLALILTFYPGEKESDGGYFVDELTSAIGEALVRVGNLR
jgi:hypothetical protein